MLSTRPLQKLCIIAALFLGLFPAASTDIDAKEKAIVYKIAVEATELEGARVLLKLNTNIPGRIGMMVGWIW